MKRSLAKSSFLVFLCTCMVASSVHAADRCEALFSEGAYHADALDLSLKKAFFRNGSVRGLSSSDLRLFVEKIYQKKEGNVYKTSDYWKLNAEERTALKIEREIGETLTHQGLERYFKENNLLIDHSLWKTKIISISRSKTMNFLTVGSVLLSLGHGTLPVFLPDSMIKTNKEDLTTLILKGFDSAEGKEILARQKFFAEADRGYKNFQRYYTRVAIAVLLYFVYEKTKETLETNRKQQADNAFDELMGKFNQLLASHSEAKSKEDILFETVLQKYQEKYGSLPSDEETRIIRQKIYGT